MYLPKSKYSNTKYTNGKEYVTEDGKYYTGAYFITYSGKFFTGNKPSNNARELRRLDVEIQKLKFTGEFIQPTEKDYEKGFIERYFSQDKRNKNVIETKKSKFLKLRQLPYVESLSLKWNLKQPAEDIVKGKYVYSGSVSKNKNLIEQAENQMAGISFLLKSPSEFVK
jgi:hypothetical protein